MKSVVGAVQRSLGFEGYRGKFLNMRNEKTQNCYLGWSPWIQTIKQYCVDCVDCVGEQQPSYADQKWLPEKGVRRVHVKKVSLCFSKFLEEKLLKTAAK